MCSVELQKDTHLNQLRSAKVLALFAGMDLPETMVVNALSERGYQIDVFCEGTGCVSSLCEQVCNIETFCSKGKIDIGAISKLWKVLSQGNYDIIHAFTARTLANVNLALIGLRLKKRPKLLGYRGVVGNLSRWDPLSYLTFRSGRVDAIWCVSRAVYDDMRVRGVSPNRLQHIYKGHQLEWYARDQSRFSLRQEHKIPEGAIVIGVCANERPNKGLDLLVEAFGSLNLFEMNAYLVVVGDVGSDEFMRSVAEYGKDRVVLVGPVSDVAGLMWQFDLYVQPTRFREGLPKTVIEAMACQRPVVVTDAGGMPELVEDGVSGLVVKKDSVSALREGLNEIIEMEEVGRAKLGKAASERIATSFAFERTVELVDRMYRAS